MRRAATAALALLAVTSATSAELFDRTVAIVGERAVLASEVDAQLRLEAMFDERELDLSDEAHREALDRLIEQRLLESDIALTNFAPLAPARLAAAQAQLRRQTFAGRSFQEALTAYDLEERQALGFLERQLRFANFIQFRFRTGLTVPDEAIQARYRRVFDGVPGAPPLEEARDRLRRNLIDEAAEQALDSRIRQLRAETRVVLLDRLAESATEEPAP